MSIDKIPAFLQVSKVVISAAKTDNRASWHRVGLLVTSSKDIIEDTQEMFD